MKYIDTPNLPKGKVIVTAISADAAEICEALKSSKIAVVPIDPCSNLPKGIASHADLQLLHLGGQKLIAASCSEECLNMLSAMGFEAKNAENALNSKYPSDCIINVNIIGKKIIMNPKTASENLIEYVDEHNMEVISVNQGYSKCSSLTICEDAIITADDGISKAVENHGIEVLKIRNGGIYLEGYDTGFIGGCGGMIEEKLLGTSGDLKSLQNKDYENIKDFCRNRNIYIENLGGRTLCDIGGILPLCEKE